MDIVSLKTAYVFAVIKKRGADSSLSSVSVRYVWMNRETKRHTLHPISYFGESSGQYFSEIQNLLAATTASLKI